METKEQKEVRKEMRKRRKKLLEMLSYEQRQQFFNYEIAQIDLKYLEMRNLIK